MQWTLTRNYFHSFFYPIETNPGHKVLSITDHYIGGTEHRERIKLVQAAWKKADELKDIKLMVA